MGKAIGFVAAGYGVVRWVVYSGFVAVLGGTAIYAFVVEMYGYSTQSLLAQSPVVDVLGPDGAALLVVLGVVTLAVDLAPDSVTGDSHHESSSPPTEGLAAGTAATAGRLVTSGPTGRHSGSGATERVSLDGDDPARTTADDSPASTESPVADESATDSTDEQSVSGTATAPAGETERDSSVADSAADGDDRVDASSGETDSGTSAGDDAAGDVSTAVTGAASDDAGSDETTAQPATDVAADEAVAAHSSPADSDSEIGPGPADAGVSATSPTGPTGRAATDVSDDAFVRLLPVVFLVVLVAVGWYLLRRTEAGSRLRRTLLD